MSKRKTLDAVMVVNRVKEYLGIKTDTDLAKALNIRQSTVSSWRSRGNLNLPEIIALCDGVNLNWLLYGTGAMHEGGKLDPVSEKVVNMLEGMDEDQRRDVLRYTEKEKLFCELQHEMEKKKAV